MSLPVLIMIMLISGFGFMLFTRQESNDGFKYRHRLERLTDRAAGQRDSGDVGQVARDTLPKLRINAAAESLPKMDLKQRIKAAGFYRPGAQQAFLAARSVMMVIPSLLCVAAYTLRPQYLQLEVLGTVALTISAYLIPNMWLDRQAVARQRALRKGLPDAMDLCVICLEGGLGFTATVQRIAEVLGAVHPALALELKIVFKRIHMGMPVGEAFSEFGKRSGVNEIKQLAAVIGESERLGGGLTSSLRGHAQALRQQRAQRAEEQAHKAGVKILFPTVGFILPALFVVMMGPAVVRIAETLMR